MYVCICNAISERELRRAAELYGLRTAAMFFEARQIGPVCGKCVPELHDLLQQYARAADEEGDGHLRVVG